MSGPTIPPPPPSTRCSVDVAVAHVGDSRAYLLRGGSVHARTRDHSAVESLYQQGQITEAQRLLGLAENALWFGREDMEKARRLMDDAADALVEG